LQVKVFEKYKSFMLLDTTHRAVFKVWQLLLEDQFPLQF
jgi:hypothetical protein